MIIQERVMVKWGRTNKRKLESKGYAFTNYGDEIEVSISDLSHQSNVIIECVCDYCYEKYKTKYTNIVNGHKVIDKDACENCRGEKTKESNQVKYGVENVNQIKEVREKATKTNIEKYGVSNVSQNDVIKNKKKETCLENWGFEYSLQNETIREKGKITLLEKYGVDVASKSEVIKNKTRETNMERYGVIHAMQLEDFQDKVKSTNMKKYGYEYVGQVPKFKEKINKTFYKNGTQKVSSQQLEVFNMLKERGFEVELNYPVSNVNLDVAIFIGEIKIDLEYDGWYWHQDRQKDRKRDEFIKSQGWKILRIRSERKIPLIETIINKIESLTTTNKTFSQIILDDWKEVEKDVI